MLVMVGTLSLCPLYVPACDLIMRGYVDPIVPFLNSVEIQAQAPAMTAMTINENAIEPRSSPTFSLPATLLCLLATCDSCSCVGFPYVENKSSSFQSRRVNKKIIGVWLGDLIFK